MNSTAGIDAIPRSQRFLMVAWRLSDAAWKGQCDLVVAWLESCPKELTDAQRDQMRRTIEKPLSDTEHPIVVIHCYADVPTGTQWDTVFDPADPNSHSRTTAISRFGVVCDRAVELTLPHGCHQTVIIDFPDGLPELIQSVPIDVQDPNRSYVCVCKREDFPEIERHLKDLF